MRLITIFLMVLLVISCREGEILPKPKAQLRLEYPPSKYEYYKSNCEYKFLRNIITRIDTLNDCTLKIVYPSMNAKIHLNYKMIRGNIDKLLADSQKFTYEHVVKADQIEESLYENKTTKVYGMRYDVIGNAASQTQFYITDSITHFLRGSLYLYAKPNYDSILPTINYINKDINLIFETMEWGR